MCNHTVYFYESPSLPINYLCQKSLLRSLHQFINFKKTNIPLFMKLKQIKYSSINQTFIISLLKQNETSGINFSDFIPQILMILRI